MNKYKRGLGSGTETLLIFLGFFLFFLICKTLLN